MLFIYKPEGADPKTWEWAPNKMLNPEAEAIERHTRMTFQEWSEAVTNGSMLALHGLIFVLLKRDVPTLKWDEVVFSMSECSFELDDEESARALAALEEKASRGALVDGEDLLLAELRAQAPTPPEEPEATVESDDEREGERELVDASDPL